MHHHPLYWPAVAFQLAGYTAAIVACLAVSS